MFSSADDRDAIEKEKDSEEEGQRGPARWPPQKRSERPLGGAVVHRRVAMDCAELATDAASEPNSLDSSSAARFSSAIFLRQLKRRAAQSFGEEEAI